jgi:hypothetical protein
VKLLLAAAATATLALTACRGSKQPDAMKATAYTKFLRGNKQEVWTARPDGSNKRRLIGRFGFRGIADGLSRDGRRVLVQIGNVELDRTQHIEIVPFAGGKGGA